MKVTVKLKSNELKVYTNIDKIDTSDCYVTLIEQKVDTSYTWSDEDIYKDKVRAVIPVDNILYLETE